MFQFVKPVGKNEEGRTIYETLTLNEIDKLACEFWGVEEHPRFYASPKILIGDKEFTGTNWFDTIGHAIEDCQYRHTKGEGHNYYHDAHEQPYKFRGAIFEASAVSAQLLRVGTIATTSAENLAEEIKYFQPYIELAFHLQNEHNIYFEALGW